MHSRFYKIMNKRWSDDAQFADNKNEYYIFRKVTRANATAPTVLDRDVGRDLWPDAFGKAFGK